MDSMMTSFIAVLKSGERICFVLRDCTTSSQLKEECEKVWQNTEQLVVASDSYAPPECYHQGDEKDIWYAIHYLLNGAQIQFHRPGVTVTVETEFIKSIDPSFVLIFDKE